MHFPLQRLPARFYLLERTRQAFCGSIGPGLLHLWQTRATMHLSIVQKNKNDSIRRSARGSTASSKNPTTLAKNTTLGNHRCVFRLSLQPNRRANAAGTKRHRLHSRHLRYGELARLARNHGALFPFLSIDRYRGIVASREVVQRPHSLS